MVFFPHVSVSQSTVIRWSWVAWRSKLIGYSHIHDSPCILPPPLPRLFLHPFHPRLILPPPLPFSPSPFITPTVIVFLPLLLLLFPLLLHSQHQTLLPPPLSHTRLTSSIGPPHLLTRPPLLSYNVRRRILLLRSSY